LLLAYSTSFLSSITFFAVPNTGIPHHQPSHGDDHDKYQLGSAFLAPKRGDERDIAHDLGHLVLQVEELDDIPESRDKDHRKEALARIIRGILAYHILPEKLDSAALVQNSTYATNLTLKDGSMDYQPLRLSVQSTIVPPRLRINTVVDVIRRDIEASNGELDSMLNHWHILTMDQVSSTVSTFHSCLPRPCLVRCLLFPKYFHTW
jgi:hypothetical protein